MTDLPPAANAELLLTVEQFCHHIGRAGADWDMSQFCAATGLRSDIAGEQRMYAMQKFRAVQEVAHFFNNNDPSLVRRMIEAHIAQEKT